MERQAKRPRLEVPSSSEDPPVPSAAARLTAELHAERQRRLGAALPSHCAGEEQGAGARPAAEQQQAEDRAGGTSRGAHDAVPPGVSRGATATGPAEQPGTAPLLASSDGVSILTWNIWFEEGVALMERMAAVGATIEAEGYPDLLLFQEVTPHILLIFSQAAWFRRYRCSPPPQNGDDGPFLPYFVLLLTRRDTVVLPPPPDRWEFQLFANTQMARGLLYTRAVVRGRPLVVGTVHLESPAGAGSGTSQQKREQLAAALQLAEAAAGPGGDALVAGDFNWFEDRMGPMRLPPRWADAWLALRPQAPGFTYDARVNGMLNPRYNGSRIDRVAIRLCSSGPGGKGWRLGDTKLLGLQAIPGVRAAAKGKKNTRIWPSDHFGILLRLLPAPHIFSGSGRILGGGGGGSARPIDNAATVPCDTSGPGPSAAAAVLAACDHRVASTSAAIHVAAANATQGEGNGGSQRAGEQRVTPSDGSMEAAGGAGAGADDDASGGRAGARVRTECVDLTLDD